MTFPPAQPRNRRVARETIALTVGVFAILLALLCLYALGGWPAVGLLAAVSLAGLSLALGSSPNHPV